MDCARDQTGQTPGSGIMASPEETKGVGWAGRMVSTVEVFRTPQKTRSC
jgi:hypothetical protein